MQLATACVVAQAEGECIVGAEELLVFELFDSAHGRLQAEVFGGKGECPAALDDAGDDGDAVKMAFAIVQVQRHAGAENVALALFFGRLPEWREDGVAQGMKPVGTGDFALAVTPVS